MAGPVGFEPLKVQAHRERRFYLETHQNDVEGGLARALNVSVRKNEPFEGKGLAI